MTNQINYNVEYYLRREASPTFRAEIKAIVDLLQPSEDDTFVELGCGSGFLLSHLAKSGCKRVIGLDWLQTSVSLASSHQFANSTMTYGDASQLPFQTNSIDKLAAQHLIEHFSNTVQILKEWWRVLRPSGKIMLVTPNRLFPHQHWFDDPTHRHIFTPMELAQCAEEGGFRVDSLRIVNPYIFHWRLNGLAARYFQSLHRLPYFGTRGMSILLGATKVMS